MQDELRDRIAKYLAAHRLGIIAIFDSTSPLVMPVWYRLVAAPQVQALQIDYALPEWASPKYHIAQTQSVKLIVPDLSAERLCWLDCQGIAQTMSEGDGYVTLRIQPRRIDWIDESEGWGTRETWEK